MINQNSPQLGNWSENAEKLSTLINLVTNAKRTQQDTDLLRYMEMFQVGAKRPTWKDCLLPIPDNFWIMHLRLPKLLRPAACSHPFPPK